MGQTNEGGFAGDHWYLTCVCEPVPLWDNEHATISSHCNRVRRDIGAVWNAFWLILMVININYVLE